LLWAEHVAKNSARERDDILAEVRGHFDDVELVELTGACGSFAASNRFQDSMGLPLEAQHEIDKIKLSLRSDPVKLKAYLGQLIEDWPDEFPLPAAAATAPQPANGQHYQPQLAPIKSVLPLVDPQTATGEAAGYLDAARRLYGGISNATRMWAHIPYIAKAFPPYQIVMERAGAGAVLPRTLTAMILLRTANQNFAAYSIAHRSVFARNAGLSNDQMTALARPDCTDTALFSLAEHAALRWTDECVTNMAKRRDDLFCEMKKYFGDGELVEITGLCAMANHIDLTQNALRVPLESAAEIEALNSEISVDPNRVRTYLEMLYASWPEEFPPAPGAR
jgi:alkylhydroperoxidase family enzyme